MLADNFQVVFGIGWFWGQAGWRTLARLQESSTVGGRQGKGKNSPRIHVLVGVTEWNPSNGV